MSADAVDLFEQAPTYTTGEAAMLCGLPQMTLHRLAAAGIITSSVDAAGYGSKRRWSPVEVDRLCRIGDVYRQARDVGVVLSWFTIGTIWDALADGEPWELRLTA